MIKIQDWVEGIYHDKSFDCDIICKQNMNYDKEGRTTLKKTLILKIYQNSGNN